MNKGEMMRKVYSERELRSIDSAIPQQLWREINTVIHVMNYNNNNMGSLENMEEIALERGIDINEPLSKIELLARYEGHDTKNKMIDKFRFASIVPGICMNEDCDATYDSLEPDMSGAYCESCGTKTVNSCLILANVI